MVKDCVMLGKLFKDTFDSICVKFMFNQIDLNDGYVNLKILYVIVF